MVRVKVSVLFVLQVLATAIVPALARPTQPQAPESSSPSLSHQQPEQPQTDGPSPLRSSLPPHQQPEQPQTRPNPSRLSSPPGPHQQLEPQTGPSLSRPSSPPQPDQGWTDGYMLSPAEQNEMRKKYLDHMNNPANRLTPSVVTVGDLSDFSAQFHGSYKGTGGNVRHGDVSGGSV